MPIVNGINLDDYDFEESSAKDSSSLYSDSPKETVNGIDLSKYDFGEEKATASAPVVPPLTEEESFLRRIPDVGVSLVKGAVGLPETVVGLLDIMTQGYAGKGAEALGIRFKETQDILDSLYSSQQQAVNKEVADTKGFFPTIGKAIENPSFLLQTVAESAPSMIGAGGIGRGLIKFFPKLAPVIAGAIGEGVVSGGQAAEQIRQQTDTGLLNTTQAGAAGLSGMLTGVLGVVGGKLAKRLGIVDIDTLIAGGSVGAAVDDVTATAKKGVLRKMLESAISEGALEELPQSAQEQMAQNVALGKPTFDGVAEAGAVGLLAGFVMGAGGGAGGHVMSGLEILEKDQVNQDKSKEIQTFVANQGYTDLNNTDLLQAYMESDTVLKDLPDDTALSDSMAVMKSELEKRGIWPEDKLSVDIETKMAELDEKLGGTVAESSDLVRKTEGGDLDAERQVQTETEGQITEPTIPQGEDIKTEPPMADASEKIASSPSSFFGMPKIGTQNVVKAEKTPSTLPLTELSEEGMTNPPSTPEKTSQEAKEGIEGQEPEFVLARLATPKEKGGSKGRKAGFNTVEPKEGYEVVYKPYGASGEKEGAGYYYKKVGTKADVPKVQTVGKSSEKGLSEFKTIQPTTKKATVKFNVANTGEDFLISTPSGAKIDGYVKNADFPGAKSSPTRGEIFYSEVPTAEQKQGTGMALHIDALNLLKANGVKTVNMSPITPAGRAVVDKLIREGYISKALRISETGKAEHKILDKKPKAEKVEKKETPTIKKSLTVQKEETLESYARKHKINFNIPGHTNKEAISDGLLSYTKNDAIGLDKRAEEMQGLGLLGATPDGYATAGDYLYAELQKIVYNRINKKAQSLTAEEDQAIKEMKEALKRDGYDESGIEREASESDRTGKKEAYSIKDSEAHGETQSLLEADEEFVKEEETPTSKELFDTSSMFTLSGSQPVEQKSMKVPEKKGERLLDVPKQTTDELKDRLSGEKAKREFEEGKKTEDDEDDASLKVTTLPKDKPLPPKDSQALVSDILSILADGSSINFVEKIDPNRPDIQKALTQWKQGNPGASFVIEGMHRKVIVDGNTMASIIEVSMGSSDIGQTAWHEAWHSIDEIFLTANEKKILAEKLTPDIERQADIFAKYAANQKHLLPKSAKPIFERIREFFEKVGNYLKDRGFTSAEDVFNRALRGELKERAQRWAGEGQTAFQISVKHGSPFAFDRFTTDKIGSGEGGQMFGWGLYFTDKDSIAKHYAENLGKGEIRINGRTQIQASDQLKRFVSSWLTAGNFDYVKNSLNQAINGYGNAVGKEYYTLQMGHDLDVLTEIKRELDKGEQSFYDNVKYKETSRNLYNVTLHKGKDPSEYHYMDWEKPVGNKIADIIRKALPEDYIEDMEDRRNASVEEWKGMEVYQTLVDYSLENPLPGDTSMGGNPEKEASLFLLRNGIDGIKYPAGTLSTGKTDAFNYVVFDENAVTIEDRVSFKIKIAPVIKNLIGSNSKKAVNPETSFQDGKEDFKRQFKEVLGKDYSNWKAHFYLPFFKGHGPNAEPMWKRAFDNTEAGREKRSDLNTHYVRKMHDFFDMPKEKVRNIEKVLSEGDAVLAQKVRDLTSEAITAKNGGNLELYQQLMGQAQAIKTLNRYSDEDLANGITLRNGEFIKLTPQEINTYKEVRTAFDEMHRDQFKHQIEMVFGKYKDKPWYSSMLDLFEDRPDSPEFTPEKRDTLKALNKLALGKIRGKKAETIAKNRAVLMDVLKAHISGVSGITDQVELANAASSMLKAYQTEKVLMNAVKKARNRIGQQVAYFPRVREKGNVYLNIFKSETKTDKNGDEKTFKTMIHSQVVKNAEEARELWGQYKLTHKNEDLSYELGAVNKETDSTYVGVNDMNLQRVIDNAIERIRSTRNLESGEILNGLKMSMVNAVANEMKSRGFGKSNITRRLNLIEGYKKTDLQKVALDYITGMTGMMTKQETAMNFHDILKEIPRDKPKLYNDIAKYAQDMLRNQNSFDRASGKARGVTFIYYLGGNLKSALVQLTQNHVTAIPKLAEKMREWGVKGFAEAKYHKAMADAARIKVNKDTGEVTGKTLNQWEKRLLTEFLHRGNTADQYMQYITGRMQNELGQKFGAVMNVLSKPFGKMETFNRESASLAMFRMAWNHYTETVPDLEERYAKAYEEAKEYVNFTHFAYGKENLPRIATGGDLASVSARTLLTFRSFNHNYIQSIFGSKDWKTMAHSLAYVALFGGMMGLPFIKDLFDLLEKLTGKSYTKSAREVMRKFGGKTFETFGVQGLPALAGMNISGSMAIGIPLVGETPIDTVTGVMGGMYDKARKGVTFAAKGEAYKAAESLLPEMVANPMKALRMSDVGKEYFGTPGYATTSSGKPVFDENGKPLKMSMTDMALKTIGINPSDYSMRTEAQRSASNIEEYFSDWKTSIYETYRAGRTNHDSKTISKAMRQIREFNQAIVDKGASGLISRIKLSNVVKASKMEMTKKQKREALYKKNYLAS